MHGSLTVCEHEVLAFYQKKKAEESMCCTFTAPPFSLEKKEIEKNRQETVDVWT